MSNAAGGTATTSVAGFPEGAEGITPPTSPDGTGGFLSDVIVELGFVDRDTVEAAVQAAREPGQMVDRVLVETGALSEEELSRAIAERYGFDHVDLDRFEVDMGAAGLISRPTALRYHAVPIGFATDGTLIVAVADPVDALAISDIEVMTKSETRRAVAARSTIDALADRLPEDPARPPAGDHLDAGTVSPPSPTSPPVGSSPKQSAPPPPSEAPSGPRPANGGATASALEDQPAVRQQLQRATGSNGDAGREPGETEARGAALEAARERDRLRDAVEPVTQERDVLREEGRRTQQELELLRAQVDRAEKERYRLSEERERERELSTRLERRLRDDLTAAEERSAALERRLSELTATAAEAKAILQELLTLHDTLTAHDPPSESAEGPG